MARFLIVCGLVAVLMLAPGAIPAHAGGVVGNGTPGSCTEAALNTALAGGGSVTFNCGAAPHTILITGQKSINLNTTINGGGKITLDGQNAHRLFDVGAVLRLRNIVLARGFFNGDGGAIRNNSNGTLVLENSVIRDSRATLSGGAVLSTGPMTITDSVLEGNQALNGGALYPRFAGARTVIVNSVLRNNEATDTTNGWGGAILAWDGAPVRIEGSDIYSNTARQGGGIYNFENSVLTLHNNTRLRNNSATFGGSLWNDGTATLTNVTLSNNSANIGGGVFNAGTARFTNVTLNRNSAVNTAGGLFNGGTLTLTHVTLSGNAAQSQGGGGMENNDTATLSDVTFRGNTAQFGGGLANGGVATLRNVTLSDNTASTGGGLENYGEASLTNVTLRRNSANIGGGMNNANGATATLTNITFSGNTANTGGGLRNEGAAALTNVTLSGNTASIGGGIYREAGSVMAKNTIVANSPSGGNCTGAVTDSGFNLSSDTSCGFNHQPNLMLGPLADNGGPTLTHMPQPGSPAIDFVAAGCPPPDSDQRGVLRPADGNDDGLALCDAGAVEYRVVLVYLPVVRK